MIKSFFSVLAFSSSLLFPNPNPQQVSHPQGLLRSQQQFGDSFSPFANSQPPPTPESNQVNHQEEIMMRKMRRQCSNTMKFSQLILVLMLTRCSTTSSSSSQCLCLTTWRLHQMLQMTPHSSSPLPLTLLTLSQTPPATHSSTLLLLRPTRRKRRAQGRTLRIPSHC